MRGDYIMKISLLEFTVMVCTMRDSLDAPDPDGKAYAFGRKARATIWQELAKKIQEEDIELDIH